MSDPGEQAGRTLVVLVTGLSGAGRTSTLKILEDEGFEAVDNLPLSLLPILLAPGRGGDAPAGTGSVAMGATRLAVGVDLRTRGFDQRLLLDQLTALRARSDLDLRVVYLDCDDAVLIRRFTETRRRHPLATDRPVADGIRIEREVMMPLREAADVVIDTSALTLATFRQALAAALAVGGGRQMTVTVLSFAFRGGLPREADMVFDVRFLDNPHYVEELRPHDGRDPAVAAHVGRDPDFEPFLARLQALLEPLLPRYQSEGKSYLTIAVGCTGGKHRSVVTAERLAAWLKSLGTPVTLRHRDLPAAAGEGEQSTTGEATNG
ncbi:nucleotide-binding protein [Thalassobaculum fulvum]|uniref:Nucleotide-binding protein n=1 Tax=Thalassobaculum fulvum TaxID=1633335 RepID=A0A919CNM4_9PROT|nr:RNase adapter RapZ [Thalassobaculum fulvum]GHD39191.1 nucleotide-binding protein [Thalassobaculum fulvum]